MKEIKVIEKSVSVNGHYYTSIRSFHVEEKDDFTKVRLSYQSDRCSNEEFLSYIYQYIPELKEKECFLIDDDNVEWLCDWNVGKPKGGPFMVVNFFFR